MLFHKRPMSIEEAIRLQNMKDEEAEAAWWGMLCQEDSTRGCFAPNADQPTSCPTGGASSAPTVAPQQDAANMNREQLFQLHQNMCEAALALMHKKNADYANDADPFTNFNLTESATDGRISREAGIMVRLGDKYSRLFGYFSKPTQKFEVEDESVTDTALDFINYSVLLIASQIAKGKIRADYFSNAPSSPADPTSRTA